METKIKDIREKIEYKGYKKKYLAERMGISNVTLSYYLNEKRKMPLLIKAKLIGLLGL
jgi:transcriptional regulator with XRE-family HTH domain